MRDWGRYDKAKSLKDTGLTTKSIAAEMGVSVTRVRHMLALVSRRDEIAAIHAEHPSPPKWWEGLDVRTANLLVKNGFDNRSACMVFASDNLTIWRGSAVFQCGDDSEDWWRWSHKRFPLSKVNEIRVWLGVGQVGKPKAKPASAAELERARRLLERHGWHVSQPNEITPAEPTDPHP